MHQPIQYAFIHPCTSWDALPSAPAGGSCVGRMLHPPAPADAAPLPVCRHHCVRACVTWFRIPACVACFRVPLSTSVAHQVVREYLLRYGYADTLAAFDEASGMRGMPLATQ